MAYDDEEQLDAIRDWWQRNGRSVIIAAVAALAAVVGWQQWQAWQDRQAASAAGDYAAVLDAINDSRADAAANRLQALREAHADSPYPVLGTLALATAELAEGRASEAADLLAWVGSERADSPLAAVARLREAEALTAAGADAEALAALEPAPDGPLRGRYLELRGDLLMAQGDREAAVAAYREALQRVQGERRSLVEVKLFDAGGAPAS